MTVTMQDIYTMVRDTKDHKDRYWDQVALNLGLTEDDKDFENMVKAMRVSGFLKVKEDYLTIGPTPMPDGRGGVIRARRPRPDATVTHPDRLRLAPRIRLWDDEDLAGSDYLRDKNDTLVCVAGVTRAGLPTVRVGVAIADEDKRHWTGSNRGATVILDPAGAAALEQAVDETIAAAEKAAGPYRAANKRVNKAYEDLCAAEEPRIGRDAAEQRHSTEWNLRNNGKIDKPYAGYAEYARFVDELGPDDRARYDDLEAQFAALTRRTGTEQEIDEATNARRRIRAQQLAIVVPEISPEEADELLRLHAKSWRFRLRPENDRLDALVVQARQPEGLYRGTPGYLAHMLHGYDRERAIDGYRAQLARIEARARPVTAEQQGRIDAAWDELQQAQQAYDDLAGQHLHTATVAGEWGTIVLEAHQGEEGEPHFYQVDVKPASWPADREWGCGQQGEPWRPTPGQMRKMAAAVTVQVEHAKPAGWRPPPAAVPDVG